MTQGRSLRRKTQWADGPGGDDLPTLDSQAFTTTSQAILGVGISALEPLTVVRLHGFLEVILSAAAAAGDGFNWAFGIGIVSEDAFDVGIAAVPKPFDDRDWTGWIVHRMGAIHVAEAGVAGVTNTKIIEFDSRAMRKIAINETLTAIIQVGETGTSTLTVRVATRLLFKLF